MVLYLLIFLFGLTQGTAPQVIKVWPKLTVCPDFTSEATIQWWFDETAKFHDVVPYDGLWVDMNEVASFCDGRCVLIEEQEEDPDQDLFGCACTQITVSGLPWNGAPNLPPSLLL